jgi:hypothetical protein
MFCGPMQRKAPDARRAGQNVCPIFQRFARDSKETSSRSWSFAISMKLERESVSASEVNSMDRRVIRVDMPPTHAGITAALRRAFEGAAADPPERDFAELLRRLN